MAMSDLEEIMDGVRKPPRHTQQLILEQQLIRFRPDAVEAEELLPALLGRLVENEEIAHYALYLRRALERYQQRLLMDYNDDQDEAWSLHRAKLED